MQNYQYQQLHEYQPQQQQEEEEVELQEYDGNEELIKGAINSNEDVETIVGEFRVLVTKTQAEGVSLGSRRNKNFLITLFLLIKNSPEVIKRHWNRFCEWAKTYSFIGHIREILSDIYNSIMEGVNKLHQLFMSIVTRIQNAIFSTTKPHSA